MARDVYEAPLLGVLKKCSSTIQAHHYSSTFDVRAPQPIMSSAATKALEAQAAPIAAQNAADKGTCPPVRERHTNSTEARLANPEVESVLGSLGTETRNPKTYHLSSLPTLDMVTMINNEDAAVAGAVKDILPQVAKAIDGISERLQRGGRLL